MNNPIPYLKFAFLIGHQTENLLLNTRFACIDSYTQVHWAALKTLAIIVKTASADAHLVSSMNTSLQEKEASPMQGLADLHKSYGS